MSSENTFFLPTKIGDYNAFYCFCPEIYHTSLKILQLDKKIAGIKTFLPEAALMQFTKKCLIDEIKLTNDIEGVYSTRKELSSVLREMGKKEEKKRFYGLIKKYSMLFEDEDFPLVSSNDIRSIYDDLVLREVIEDKSGRAAKYLVDLNKLA